MSDDIVKRLRAEVDVDVNEPLDRLLDEAADEIERLREAITMAANRLDIAVADNHGDGPACRNCVDIALSYLRPAKG